MSEFYADSSIDSSSSSSRDDTIHDENPKDRALACTLVGAAATAASSAYTAYTKAQPNRRSTVVSVGVQNSDDCFCIVVPPDKTVEWLCQKASERFPNVKVGLLAYRGNSVPLNNEDFVYDVCCMLSPAKLEDMIVVLDDFLNGFEDSDA